MYFLDEYTVWFADCQFKPLICIYAILALGFLIYALVRSMVVCVWVNRIRKKLENVIAKKYKKN
jgi:hypothetical protein